MLQQQNWIDSRTRVLFVEAVLLNPNYDYFMFLRLVRRLDCEDGAIINLAFGTYKNDHPLCLQTVETPAIGGLVPTYQFEVTRLKKYLSEGEHV